MVRVGNLGFLTPRFPHFDIVKKYIKNIIKNNINNIFGISSYVISCIIYYTNIINATIINNILHGRTVYTLPATIFLIDISGINGFCIKICLQFSIFADVLLFI
jgi:hypothetical protein